MPVGASSSPHVRYYDTLADVPVVAVSPRWTTQDCSGCGYRVQKTLSTRTHVCPHCGLVLDRDENAALNILAAAPLGSSLSPYRRAGGNGFRFAGTHRFGTDRLYDCVRKSTRHSGWMNEASPGASFGECQRARVSALRAPGPPGV